MEDHQGLVHFSVLAFFEPVFQKLLACGFCHVVSAMLGTQNVTLQFR